MVVIGTVGGMHHHWSEPPPPHPQNGKIGPRTPSSVLGSRTTVFFNTLAQPSC